jgi:hypothetical protein
MKHTHLPARVMTYLPDDADAEQHGTDLAPIFAKCHAARTGDGSASLDLTDTELALLCDHLTEDTEWRLEQAENAGDTADAKADRRALRTFIQKHQHQKPTQPTTRDGRPLAWKSGNR